MRIAVGSVFMNHWRAWLGLAFLALAVALVALVRWVETTPRAERSANAASTSSSSVVIEPDIKNTLNITTANKSAPSARTTLTTPTASFLLTDEEVAALSPAEQQQYLRMLESLQEIQQQVEVLEQEQSQLEQRVNQRVEENAALHDELDAMRKAVEVPEDEGKDRDNGTGGNEALGAPGKAH